MPPKPGQCLVRYRHHNNRCTLTEYFVQKNQRSSATRNNGYKENVCSDCGKHYRHHTSLAKHRRLEHPVNQGTIHCQEQGCTYKCRYISHLQNHLSSVHNMEFENETLMFNNKEGKTIKTYMLYSHNTYAL